MKSFKAFMTEADLSKAGKGTFLSVLEENPDGWAIFRFSQFSGGGTKKLAGGFRSKPLAVKKANEIAKKTGERVSAAKGVREAADARPDFLLVGKSKNKWVVQRLGGFSAGLAGVPGRIKILEKGIESESRAIAVAKQIAKKTGEEVQVDRSKGRR